MKVYASENFQIYSTCDSSIPLFVLLYSLSDPEVLDLPLLKKPIHFYKERTDAPKVLQDTVKIIEEADAFVVVTAEYNHCMPPALTNLMDHFPIKSYKYRPTGIVSYSAGSFGGVRAGVQVRALMGELGSPTVGTTLPIPVIKDALSPEGDALNDRVDNNAEKVIKDLSWYAEALKKHRNTVGLPV